MSTSIIIYFEIRCFFTEKTANEEIHSRFGCCFYAFCSLAAVRVFFRSMVMVMGPTPPGTGVI